MAVRRFSGAGLILFQDCLLSLTGSLLSVLLVRWLSDPIPAFTRLVLLWLCIALVASVLGELVSGCHRVVRRWATVRSTARLVLSILIKEGVMSVIVLTGLLRFPSAAHGVLAILSDTLFTAVTLFYIRFAVNVFSKGEVSRVKVAASRMNALVMGTGAESVALARELRGSYNVVGFLTEDGNLAGRVIMDVVVYHVAGRPDLERLEWRLGGVDCVFFPKGRQLSDGVPHDNNTAESHYTNNEETRSSEQEMTDISTMSRMSQYLKRCFDLGLSGVLMLAFSPLAIVSAIAIRMEDGGPVLYRQERLGRGGRPFEILKFRSMRLDAEKDGAHLYSGSDDPRLTRVGGFLRRHHLDELPQLWNVFRGDMSFIGYRPERPYYIRQIMRHNPRYRFLYQIRPGVTSYATLYNGYTDTMDKMLTRLDLDLYYLRNQSLWFDAKVLGLTFLSIVAGKEF